MQKAQAIKAGAAAIRWSINANFNNSLIIGVRPSLDHSALSEQATLRGETEGSQWDRDPQH